MVVFGRRVALVGAVYAFVLLMSTATGQVAAETVECLYTKRGDKYNGWAKFGDGDKDVCKVALELMNQESCGLLSMPTLSNEIPLESSWYTASEFVKSSSPEKMKECACDRVMFNILSACAGCYKWEWSHINNTHIQWQTFEKYREGVCFNGHKKKRVIAWNPPPPAWATSFSEDTFDPNFDTNIATATASAPTSSDSATSSPTSTNTVVEAFPTPGDVAQPTSSSGPPIGVIVGGVIGGLVLLGGIAGLAFWLHRRKRRARDVAPSSEFLKPEYYTTPPLLPAHERRESAYHDDMEDEVRPSPTNRHSWGGGLVTTRRDEEDDDDCEMLPPFTRGTYIGPSPHEKGHPERRGTGDTDITMRTNNTTSFLLSSPSPTRRPGPSDHFS